MVQGEELKKQLLELAEKKGLQPTWFFDRIVKAKERFGLDFGCPCDKDNPKRYCISKLCFSDIKRDGECHCRAYQLKDKK